MYVNSKGKVRYNVDPHFLVVPGGTTAVSLQQDMIVVVAI